MLVLRFIIFTPDNIVLILVYLCVLYQMILVILILVSLYLLAVLVRDVEKWIFFRLIKTGCWH